MRISDWSSDVCSSDLSLGAAYVSHIKADVFEMKARKYPTSLAASLSSNNIPEGVYRTLVKETNTGLPQLHRYFELRSEEHPSELQSLMRIPYAVFCLKKKNQKHQLLKSTSHST